MIVVQSGVRLAAQAVPLGFGAPDTAAERAFEARLIALGDTVSPRELTRTLSRVPHMAGTPAQATTRDFVIARLHDWGLETSVHAYDVYIPAVTTVQAWTVGKAGATPQPLVLAEPAVAGDVTSSGPQLPPFNGYTAEGDVTIRRDSSYVTENH